MDEGKILLVNLAKGIIGEDTATLLGSLLVNRAGLAALSRADTPEARRRDFYLYLDEFQNFTTLSLANMLSELRKYRVSLTLSHQYLSQLDPKLRDAILGNVGTAIVFRIGGTDAEILSKEFYPEFSLNDLTSLPDYHIYLKLMIDGVISRPFSAITLAPKKTDA
jgi:DNA helicase HerA-like ATPase